MAGKMTPRDYQIPAIDFLKGSRRALLEAPAGSGKTAIATMAVDDCLKRASCRKTIKVLANTIEQCEQWEAAFAVFDIRGRADVEIGCGAGNLDPSEADLLIVDEAHHSSAPSWSSKIRKAKKARWALSATPFRDQDHKLAMVELFSQRFYRVERSQLVEDGHLAKAKVKYLSADCKELCAKIEAEGLRLIGQRMKKLPGWIRNNKKAMEEQLHRCRWQAAQDIGIWNNSARDQLIIEEANALIQNGAHLIVLVGKIEHGEKLQKEIPGACLCFSKMGRKSRKASLDGFKSGEIRCVIATSLLDEGADFPIADSLIVASAGRSFRKVVQTTGRVLRKFDGKDSGLIVDFTDDFFPMLARQSKARRKIYMGLNYQFT